MNIEEFIDTIPFARDCNILAFDECGLVAILKKAGRASHPNTPKGVIKGKGKPLIPMVMARYNLKEEYYSWEIPNENDPDADPKKARLYLINRLDSPTSGIILAATTKEVADAAKAAFLNKTVKKTYHAICVGMATQKYGKWLDRIKEYKGNNFVRGKTDNSGQLAVCSFYIEALDKNGAGLSLIRLEPETGLTHQLRIQCSQHKMPILGDATYGNFQANKRFKKLAKVNRLFLHCSKTEIDIQLGDKKIHFSAETPLPNSFATLMEYNPQIIKVIH